MTSPRSAAQSIVVSARARAPPAGPSTQRVTRSPSLADAAEQEPRLSRPRRTIRGKLSITLKRIIESRPCHRGISRPARADAIY